MAMFFKAKKIDKVVIALIVGGIILRFLKAWYFTPVLTQDEASIYLSSQFNSFAQHLLRTKEYINAHYTSPPLFFLLSKVWISLTTNTYILRLPTIICSLLTLFLSWKSAKLIDLKSKEKNFLIAHLLSFYICFSVFFIFYGVIYRTYSLGILFASTTIYYFLKILNTKRPTALQLFGFGSSLWLGLMTNYGLVWFYPALAIIVLINFRRIKELTYTFVISSLLYLPWVFVFFRDMNTMVTSEDRGFKSSSLLGGFLEVVSRFFISNDSLLRYYVQHDIISYTIAGLIILGLVGAFRAYKLNKNLSLFLLTGILLPYGVVITFSYFSDPVIDYKNLFLPNLFVMVGFILFFILLKNKPVKYGFVMAFVTCQTLLTITDLPKHRRGPNIPKEIYSEVLRNLKDPMKNIKIIAVDRELDPLIVYGSWKYHMSIQIYDLNSERMKDVPKEHRPLYFLSLFEDYEQTQLSKAIDNFNCKLQTIPTEVHIPIFGKCLPQSQ